jgi:hypothetical protein
VTLSVRVTVTLPEGVAYPMFGNLDSVPLMVRDGLGIKEDDTLPVTV